MKRFARLIALGLVFGLAAYTGTYFLGTATARKISTKKMPELGWLKKEFNLGDAEFDRICELHAAYQPKCAEMCGRIDAKNEEIKAALANADRMTPEISRKLAEAAELRAECEQAMLQHFFEVSHSMSQEEGRRYLAWVEAQTFLPMSGMSAASTVSPQQDHGDH